MRRWLRRRRNLHGPGGAETRGQRPARPADVSQGDLGRWRRGGSRLRLHRHDSRSPVRSAELERRPGRSARAPPRRRRGLGQGVHQEAERGRRRPVDKLAAPPVPGEAYRTASTMSAVHADHLSSRRLSPPPPGQRQTCDPQPVAGRGRGPVPASAQHRHRPARPAPAPQQRHDGEGRSDTHGWRTSPVRWSLGPARESRASAGRRNPCVGRG